jgi:hypothetical protein
MTERKMTKSKDKDKEGSQSDEIEEKDKEVLIRMENNQVEDRHRRQFSEVPVVVVKYPQYL